MMMIIITKMTVRSSCPFISYIYNTMHLCYSCTEHGTNYWKGTCPVLTGGCVFWRQARIKIIFSSCLTYSTSWMTSRFAAPARPTFTVTGFTSALRAKFWIFFGIVAENSNVCLWPCTSYSITDDNNQSIRVFYVAKISIAISKSTVV